MARNYFRQKIRNEISELFSEGEKTSEDILGLIPKKSLQKTLQEMLEQEVEKKLAKGYYERRSDDSTEKIYRNGYEPDSLRELKERWR